MKALRSGMLTALVLALLLTAGESVATAAPGDTTDPSGVTARQDYLTAPAIQAAGQEQCALDVSARTGAWVCPDGATGQELADQARTANGIPTAAEAEAASATYCQAAGCWTVVNTQVAEFSGGGAYGYGDEPLGEISVYYELRLNGGMSTSYPVRFTSTRGSNVTIEGERLYVSAAQPQGAPVNGGGSYDFRGPYAANADQQITWPSPGYSFTEQTVSRTAVVHQWTWTDASSAYPGNWFFYAKSNVATNDGTGAYNFGSPDDVPETAASSGYHPS